MTDKHPMQLIIDPPAAGPWNMAVDEVLLERAAETKTPTLRLYQWERPTLSLGYFQSYEDRHTHPASEQADVVRRQSGGGAILHDREITYSLTIPDAHQLAADPQSLYLSIHRGLIDWLNGFIADDCEFSLATFEATNQISDKRDEPFLCFQRRSTGDVVMRKPHLETDHKIIGSAQRRRRGAILQHGSILWETSSFAQEICGFANLVNVGTTLSAAQDSLIEGLPALFDFECMRTSISADVDKQASQLSDQRYCQGAWTKRR